MVGEGKGFDEVWDWGAGVVGAGAKGALPPGKGSVPVLWAR